MWKENDIDKTANGSHSSSSETGHSDESDETHLAYIPRIEGSASHPMSRPRSVSTSTHASQDSTVTANGVANGKTTSPSGTGYELCPSCIEVRGLEHSRSAAMVARHRMPPTEWNRISGELRHTFREKVWGPQGWQDVGESYTIVFCALSSCSTDEQNTMRILSVPSAAR